MLWKWCNMDRSFVPSSVPSWEEAAGEDDGLGFKGIAEADFFSAFVGWFFLDLSVGRVRLFFYPAMGAFPFFIDQRLEKAGERASRFLGEFFRALLGVGSDGQIQFLLMFGCSDGCFIRLQYMFGNFFLRGALTTDKRRMSL
jgi:hypothetical protein